MAVPLFKDLVSELHPRFLLPSIAAAIVIAAIEIVIAISLGALVFSGPLKMHLTSGISLMLLSTVIYALIFALFSKFRGMIGGLQDPAIAILAVLAMSIIASTTFKDSNQVLLTVILLLAITAILTGILLIIIGSLKLGKLVRYIPYPVIGGFLAGAGWLLVVGSISMLTDLPVALSSVSSLFSSEYLSKWLPSVIYGLVFYLITRKFDHYSITPALIIAAIIGFYVFIGFDSESIQLAIQNGYLFKPAESSSFFQPVLIHEFVNADFPSILNNMTSISGIVIICIITILLCITGIEISLRRDMDLNYELKLNGFANLIAGFCGGVAGTPLISGTVLVSKIKASTRLTGILFAIITLIVMFYGAKLITLIPKFVLGGLLFFIGISLLVEWLYDSFKKFSRAEYTIIALIVGFIATIGFLEGVGIGLILSIVYFVLRYSKVSIIYHKIFGHQMRSTVQRPKDHWKIIESTEEDLIILKLQGFLFFGTSNNLVETANRMMEIGIKHIIVDFRRVTGFDSSAALCFIKLFQMADDKERSLLFSSINNSTREAFENSGIDFKKFDCLHVFDDLDHALECYEETVLNACEGIDKDNHGDFLLELERNGVSIEDATVLFSYPEKCEVKSGDYLIKQGDKSRDLYFVESGRLTVELETESGQLLRVSTLNPGVFFGEMSYYLKQTRSANIVADENSKLLHFTEETLNKIEEEHPAVAVAFHTLMATSLSERLQHTDNTLRSVLM